MVGINGLTLKEAYDFCRTSEELANIAVLETRLQHASENEKPALQQEIKNTRNLGFRRFIEHVDHRVLVVTGMLSPTPHDAKRRVIRSDQFRRLGRSPDKNWLMGPDHSFVNVGIYPMEHFKKYVSADRNRFEGVDDVSDWFGKPDQAAEASAELASNQTPSDDLSAIAFSKGHLRIGSKELFFRGPQMCKIIQMLCDAHTNDEKIEQRTIVDKCCPSTGSLEKALGKRWAELQPFIRRNNGFIWLDAEPKSGST